MSVRHRRRNAKLERRYTMTTISVDHAKPRFPLGRLLITPGAQAAFSREEVFSAVSRHQRGDWGTLCKEDCQRNNGALRNGERIFSAYQYHEEKLWIITEADRSATTILLPHEY
jgi:hypothetical protein